MRQRYGAVLAMVGGLTALAPSAWGQSTSKPFPDDWFFDGANRPATLKAMEGKPAPALSIDTWIGSETSVKASRGKVVVVDFWATWCGPCMASLPHNVELVKQHAGDGMVFIGVHDSNSGWERADGVVKEKGINYPVGKDKVGASVKDYAVQFWPTYVVIDRGGVVRAAGLIPNRVDDVVKELLAEAAPEGPEVAEEFAPDFYYGGAARPKQLKAMEGKPAPALKSAAWIGKPFGSEGSKDTVQIVTFVSPALTVSLNELDKLAPVEKEFGPQGVTFLAVCDGRGAGMAGGAVGGEDANWKKMEARARAKSLTLPIMRDAVASKAGDDGKGVETSVTAAAFGIEHYPTTVVVDRSGKIRAAGVKAAKLKTMIEKLLAEQVKEDSGEQKAK